MPELPEVEVSRRRVEKALRGKRLERVLPDEDDRICFDRATATEVRVALEGARVKGTGRKGKYFWLELDRRPWPVFHLGMTGNVEIRRKAGGKFERAWGGAGLWQESRRPTVGPAARLLPFCRLRVVAEDGTEMAITDPRRFGRIRLAQDPLAEPPISVLGFDPLLDFPRSPRLRELLARRKAPLKSVLLDQSLFAGVGNWIADELLYQARISPHRLASSLDAREAVRLRAKLLAIVNLAVKVDADYDRYPPSWLFHHRWGKQADAKAGGRHRIVHDTIGGRTTAWVPSLQE